VSSLLATPLTRRLAPRSDQIRDEGALTLPPLSHARQIAEEAGASAASVSYAAIRAKRTVNPFAAASAVEEANADPRGAAPAAASGRASDAPKRAGAGAGALSGDAALRVPTREVKIGGRAVP